MAAPRRGRRARANAAASRFTIDASVFVNAFNPHERGHAESLQVITTIHERGDPIIVPALLVPEVASALARVTGDSAAALDYARAITSLPHLTVISLTVVAANHAAELAAKHRVRGADAVYLAVARRYGTAIVTRDAEQRARGSSVVACLTPEETLRGLGRSDR